VTHEITAEMALRAHNDLRLAAESAIIAHYSQHNESTRTMMIDNLAMYFETAARSLGYTITKEATHDVAQAPSRDPDGGRASSELGAPETALPALNHNCGA
jgi:hypothetical protein